MSHFKFIGREEKQRLGVQHNYHDHSRDIDNSGAALDSGLTVSSGAHPPPFPVRLHYVLSELSKDGLSGGYLVSKGLFEHPY